LIQHSVMPALGLGLQVRCSVSVMVFIRWLRVFQPSVPPIRRKTQQTKDRRSPEALAMHQIMCVSDLHP
ncbi:hypothetical protein EDB19DRAFT_1753894, partial [Suillus lakei]